MFYHTSMLAGDAVLLDRIQAVVPFHLKCRVKLLHLIILAARLISGVIDVARVHISYDVNDGGCDYRDSHAVSRKGVKSDGTHSFETRLALSILVWTQL